MWWIIVDGRKRVFRNLYSTTIVFFIFVGIFILNFVVIGNTQMFSQGYPFIYNLINSSSYGLPNWAYQHLPSYTNAQRLYGNSISNPFFFQHYSLNNIIYPNQFFTNYTSRYGLLEAPRPYYFLPMIRGGYNRFNLYQSFPTFNSFFNSIPSISRNYLTAYNYTKYNVPPRPVPSTKHFCPITGRPLFAEGEILVKFKPGVNLQEIRNVYLKYNAYEIHHSIYGGFKRVGIPPMSSVLEMCQYFNQEPSTLYAEPNYIYYASFIPTDEFYLLHQWHLQPSYLDTAGNLYYGIDAQTAWDFSTGASIIAAVLDSGVAYGDYYDPVTGVLTYQRAPDLANTIFIPGYDFVNDDSVPLDDLGHGTFVAEAIAENTNVFNVIGINLAGIGVAHDCQIMPVKIMSSDGQVFLSDGADGIYYAANYGARIINMSWGGFGIPSATLVESIDYAYYDKGVLCVAAAGNDGVSEVAVPASLSSVVAVSATRLENTITAYSNYGIDIELCAPGGQLYIDLFYTSGGLATYQVPVDNNGDGWPDGVCHESLRRLWNQSITNYTLFRFFASEGTSFAAPLVSGVASLVLARNSLLSPPELRRILQTTARDLGPPGWDPEYGYGMVNAFNAVFAVL